MNLLQKVCKEYANEANRKRVTAVKKKNKTGSSIMNNRTNWPSSYINALFFLRNECTCPAKPQVYCPKVCGFF